MTGVAPEQIRKNFEYLFGCETQIALPGEVLSNVLSPGHVSHAGNHAPVDRGRLKTLRAAISGERIQERVRRRIISLLGISQHRGNRRERHKEIERIARRMRMQVPRTHHLRAHHAIEQFVGHLAQRSVFQHHGCVNDPAQGRQAFSNSLCCGGSVAFLETSPFTTSTRAPSALNSDKIPSASGEGWLRPISASVRAPCATSHEATFSPSPPSPPVIRYVASARITGCAGIAARTLISPAFRITIFPMCFP